MWMRKFSLIAAIAITLSLFVPTVVAQPPRMAPLRFAGVDADTLFAAGWTAAELPALFQRLDAWIATHGAAYQAEVAQVRVLQRAQRAAERACKNSPESAELRTALDSATASLNAALEAVQARKQSLTSAILEGASNERLAAYETVKNANRGLPIELRSVGRSAEEEDRLLRALTEVASAAANERTADPQSVDLVEVEYRRPEVSQAIARETERDAFKAAFRSLAEADAGR